MSEVHILIVEDEPIIADDIAICVDQMGHKVVAICNRAEKALSALEEEEVDLILLDVKIKGDTDGIQLAQQIREKYQIPFIFITSYYDKTTLARAKNTKPAGYIVKPFKDQDIHVTIDMVLTKLDIEPIIETKNEQLNIFIREKNVILPLDLNEVLYIEAFDSYSILHLENTQHTVSQTLKTIEAKLRDLGYARIHKKFIVNLRKIDRVEYHSVFIKDFHIPIGKVYRKDFLEQLTIF